ncbi:hypothetical protein LINPERPRIM_LOCUS21863, partial [Linum perenne]
GGSNGSPDVAIFNEPWEQFTESSSVTFHAKVQSVTVEPRFSRGRASLLHLGSMVMPPLSPTTQTPSQHLGLGMSDMNLGMLAALNAYSRGGLNVAEFGGLRFEGNRRGRREEMRRRW